jgi:hypothetical protein
LDAAFARTHLLQSVAKVRQQRDQDSGQSVLDVDSYLNPLIAREIYSTVEDGNTFTDGAVEAAGPLLRGIERARGKICRVLPEWREYFSLPVRLMALDTQVYFGYSCLAEPQHIYLGSISDQLRDEELLLENYLHEFAHLWLYLLQELSPFQSPHAETTYTLPSGTAGRSLTATIDAAFVASVLRHYYARLGDIPRRRELSAYIGGCLMAIRGDSQFTAAGQDVCLRLATLLTVAA